MTKRVLDVGNCAADHAALRAVVEGNFDAQLDCAHSAADTLELLQTQCYDLVLINRILDSDGSEGMQVLKQVKHDPQLSRTPVMLITNYAEHQQQAVKNGALEGFGKSSLHAAETREKLRKLLG